MPTKRTRRSRNFRQDASWRIETLCPVLDTLTLHSGLRHDPAPPARVRIRTLEDARAAWQANRALFMRLCECHRVRGRCDEHALRHQAGVRPWAFWVFDQGMDGFPADQVAELERLGLLTDDERELLALPHP